RRDIAWHAVQLSSPARAARMSGPSAAVLKARQQPTVFGLTKSTRPGGGSQIAQPAPGLTRSDPQPAPGLTRSDPQPAPGLTRSAPQPAPGLTRSDPGMRVDLPRTLATGLGGLAVTQLALSEPNHLEHAVNELASLRRRSRRARRSGPWLPRGRLAPQDPSSLRR